MKVDLTKKILDFEDKEVKDESGKSMTIADVFKTTLMTNLEEDNKESADDRLWRWETGKRIYKNSEGSIELKVEEVVKLKERVKQVYLSPIIYGNICSVLK